MKILTIDRWQVMCDFEATVAAYTAGDKWGKKFCSCQTCENFFVAIDQAYPPEFLSILGQVGIRAGQETEVYHFCRMDTGLHSYGGWFYFVGSLLSGDDGLKKVTETLWKHDAVQMTESFNYLLTSQPNWIPSPFEKKSIVTVEFNTEIPWLLDADEPS